MWAAVGLLGGATLCWAVREQLFGWICMPYATAWRDRFPELVKAGQSPEMMTTAPADAFVNYMQLSVVGNCDNCD